MLRRIGSVHTHTFILTSIVQAAEYRKYICIVNMAAGRKHHTNGNKIKYFTKKKSILRDKRNLKGKKILRVRARTRS